MCIYSHKEAIGQGEVVIMTNSKRVLILGAGYAGLLTARNLQKRLGKCEMEITLINKHSYHFQSTWLHENASGHLTDDRIQVEISDVLDLNKVNVVKDVVTELDVKSQTVYTRNGAYAYDYLVVGLGFEPETFGIPGLKEYGLSMSSMNGAKQIRAHIEDRFANYQQSKDIRDLTIIVGGAGFTGIEFIAQLSKQFPQLCKAYNIDPTLPKIICVEAMNQVLPGFDTHLVESAMERLQAMDIEFQLSSSVVECVAGGIRVKKEDHEEMIEGNTVVWAAGIRGSSVLANSAITNNRGRVLVTPYLQAPNYDNVFVVGDCSLVVNPETNRPYPPTAQLAIGQSYTLANNIIACCTEGAPTEPFVFKSKGTVCSMGHNDGVGIVFGLKLKGKMAAIMKNIIDNRWLFLIGGPKLVLKKGKFKFI